MPEGFEGVHEKTFFTHIIDQLALVGNIKGRLYIKDSLLECVLDYFVP